MRTEDALRVRTWAVEHAAAAPTVTEEQAALISNLLNAESHVEEDKAA